MFGREGCARAAWRTGAARLVRAEHANGCGALDGPGALQALRKPGERCLCWAVMEKVDVPRPDLGAMAVAWGCSSMEAQAVTKAAAAVRALRRAWLAWVVLKLAVDLAGESLGPPGEIPRLHSGQPLLRPRRPQYRAARSGIRYRRITAGWSG